MKRIYPFIFLIFTACLYASSKDVAEQVFEGFQTPSNFPAPVYHFSTNQVTQPGFELGRKLFYEPRLSRNNTISCGNCHIQSSAFTQHGHKVSHGIEDRLGTRNSPPIMNLAWSPLLMWDGGIFDLDLQPIAPITNHAEMDETVENVLNKLRGLPEYKALFKKAFGAEDITTATMVKGLSQLMVMCVSSNAKYDSVIRRQGPSFTAEEESGYALYKTNCSSCHKEPLFTDNSFRNNGIAIGANNDMGRYPVTLNEADKYKFKVPSLRNLSYTAPFMHDGRFATIDEVLEHYTNHVQATQNLDPLLQQNGTTGIALTANEKTKIISFLKTLNDRAFVTDRKLSEQ